MKPVLFLLLALGACNAAWADVQVKYKDATGAFNTMRSNGHKVRINGGPFPGYLLFDSVISTVYMIDTCRNEIVKLSTDEISAVSSEKPLNVGLKSLGGSEKIAGYKTGRFNLIANGLHCGTLYGSSELIEKPELASMLEAMQSMHKLSSTRMAGLGVLSECQQASAKMADLVDISGFVMRYIDDQGKTLFEVTSVKTDKKVAADYYSIPSGMTVIDMNEKMDQATQQMPNMDEMMKQIEQSGGEMSPELQQQMQQMMEQLQQPQ